MSSFELESEMAVSMGNVKELQGKCDGLQTELDQANIRSSNVQAELAQANAKAAQAAIELEECRTALGNGMKKYLFLDNYAFVSVLGHFLTALFFLGCGAYAAGHSHVTAAICFALAAIAEVGIEIWGCNVHEKTSIDTWSVPPAAKVEDAVKMAENKPTPEEFAAKLAPLDYADFDGIREEQKWAQFHVDTFDDGTRVVEVLVKRNNDDKEHSRYYHLTPESYEFLKNVDGAGTMNWWKELKQLWEVEKRHRNVQKNTGPDIPELM